MYSEFGHLFLSYILLFFNSYKYSCDDGRVCYPLFLLFWCPQGINTVENILYASSKPALINKLVLTRVFFSIFFISIPCIFVFILLVSIGFYFFYNNPTYFLQKLFRSIILEVLMTSLRNGLKTNYRNFVKYILFFFRTYSLLLFLFENWSG